MRNSPAAMADILNAPMAGIGGPGMLPDLSHLTREERQIIESVMVRQQREDEEAAMELRKKQEEVYLLEQAIRARNCEQQALGHEMEATCQICLKTKFADGVGHCCNYCGTRCCARCGGKVTLRSNKNIWVCILCRKKQELLIKTGQWIHSSMADRLKQLEATADSTDTPLFERVLSFAQGGLGRDRDRDNQQHNQQQQQQSGNVCLNFIRRSSLGMITAASPKTHPIRELRRQFSHETQTELNKQPGKLWQFRANFGTSFDSGTGTSAGPTPPPPHTGRTGRNLPQPQVPTASQKPPRKMPDIPRPSLRRLPSGGSDPLSSTSIHQMAPIVPIGTASQPHVPMQSSGSSMFAGTVVTSSQRHPPPLRKLPPRQKSRELPCLEDVLVQQQPVPDAPSCQSNPSLHMHYSSKKHLPRIPSLPEQSYAKSTGNLCLETADSSSQALYHSGSSLPGGAEGTDSGFGYSRSYSGDTYPLAPITGRVPRMPTSKPSLFSSTSTSSAQFDSMSLPGPGGVVRNDSLSSDPASEFGLRRPSPSLTQQTTLPRTPYHSYQPRPRLRSARRIGLYKSLSSSEDEVRSTPELSTEDDFDLESECTSEPRLLGTTSNTAFHGKLKPDDILDAKMRNFLVKPITWKLSHDKSQLIGHMILKKHLSNDATPGTSAAILGLKVVGGRVVSSGRLGAVIERVKKGSIADTIGRLRPGDEVLEWNGIALSGKTLEEVADIIADSKQDPQVELLLSRPYGIAGTTNKPRIPPLQSYPSLMSREEFIQQNRIGRRHTDVIPGGTPPNPLDYDKSALLRGSSLGAELTARSTPGALPPSLALRPAPYVKVTRSSTVHGRLQVKLWYDAQTLELMVTVLSAIELTPRKTGLLRNPFVKLYLLPDRTEKTRRRTRTAVNSLEPVWKQTFVYAPVGRSELSCGAVELSLLDFDRYGSCEFLGMVLLELNATPLDDEPHWYILLPHEEVIAQLAHRQQLTLYYPHYYEQQRLSPASTLSRLSDSDLSELDFDDDYNTSRGTESWRLLETSQSSLGSSGSPPGTETHGAGVSSSRSLAALRAQSAASAGYFAPDVAMQSRPMLPPVRTPAVAGTSSPHGGPGRRHYSDRHHYFGEHQSASFGAPATVTSPDLLPLRPEFRKSSSQPIHRSLSPPLRAPLAESTLSSSGGHVSGAGHFYRQNTVASLYGATGGAGRNFKKRHLPSIPAASAISASSGNLPLQILAQDRSHMGLDLSSSTGPPYSRNASTAYQPVRTQELSANTPLGMYSDSEVTLRPVFGNRPLYTHPLRDLRQSSLQATAQFRHHQTAHQAANYRSSDELGQLRRTSSGSVGPSVARRASQHQPNQQQQPHQQHPHQAQHHQPHHDPDPHGSESDSFQTPRPHPLPSTSSGQHPPRSHHHRAPKIDYRALSNAEDEDEEGTTEYDEQSDDQGRHQHHRPVQRKHSDPSRRESRSAESHGHSSSHHNRGSSSLARRNSRGSRKKSIHQQQAQQPPPPPPDSELGDDSEETASSTSKMSSTNQGAFTGRPKGSRTLSEFTGRSQQHSGPVHPSNPSRSSQAVARALSERSKEDRSYDEGSSSGHASKSYSDQIDEVMEQLNANCDLSMDDLFGATNSASTSTLNASGSDKGKKKGMGQGLTKKSNSTSQLSVAGTKKRLGFRKKQATSFSVHRSEEVLPDEMRHLVKQHSSVSSDGEGSLSGNSSVDWMPSNMRQQSSCGGGSEGDFSNFVEGLGPGQIVGRQALASSSLGDIQLSLQVKSGTLDVEVVRARGLIGRSGARTLPATYVKVYMLRNRKVIQKCKTSPALRRTLDPLFQKVLQFMGSFKGCSLHVTVWGDYGRMDKKAFMGLVQIVLDDIDLSSTVMGWYKLFDASSVTNMPAANKGSNSAGPSYGGGPSGGRGGSMSGSISGSISGGGSLMSASMESFN